MHHGSIPTGTGGCDALKTLKTILLDEKTKEGRDRVPAVSF
ncbi:MAG: hypothetical protein QOJ42_8093 [Acidobacteriaceae bacterium]|jgi:hypothetical protein|nr:hypothetical protein [Acidobacteriaceae bacterium]